MARFLAQLTNKNPRNMEMLGKLRRSNGYQFEIDRDLRSFIYKVELIQTKSHQEAFLTHYKDGVVLSASTKEKDISKQLYSNTDTCAAMNLGRILAIRCLQSGIYFAKPGVTKNELDRSKHQQEFFKKLEEEGLQLVEPEIEEHSYANDKSFVWERYPLKENRQNKLDEL